MPVIICIDIGNTNIKYGIYKGKELVISFRVSTDNKRTSDEYGSQLMSMLEFKGIPRQEITGGIMSSVVPSLDYTILHMCHIYLGFKPLLLAPGLKSGLNIHCDNAKEVGADRIVNCVSAIVNHGEEGKPLIVIDFGTATTFNILNAQGEFVGGVIAPGIKGSLDSLVNGTAKLPRVEIEAPKSVIAKNTVTNMQAGIVFGFAGLVEYIIKKINKEMKCEHIRTVATGGFSEIIAKEIDCIDVVDKLLTLKGLNYLYYLNSSKEKEEA
jgi:type III pantothenate kinase